MVRNLADTANHTVGVVTVDDQPLFRDVARAVVDATAGFTLLGEAACGEDAVRLAARLQPDLMLVDVGLPDISGFETCVRLARLHPRPFVLVISANEDPIFSELAGSHGAIGFLSKRALHPRTLRGLWAQREGSEGG